MGHEQAPRPKGFAFPTTATLPAIFRKVVGLHPFLLWSSLHHTLQPWWSKHATPLLGAWLFPGFAVPEGGYGPSGNPLQATPAIGFNVDPRGLVPVNCTSTDGSTSCTTPTGKSFAEPTPGGFPARIDRTDPNYHYYHFQSEPLDVPAEKLLQ